MALHKIIRVHIMGSYFNFLLRKTAGTEKPKKELKTIIEKPKIVYKPKKVYRRRRKIRLNSSNMGAIVGAAVVFIIMITVFGKVSSSLNTSGLSMGLVNMINLIPLLLVGAAVMGLFVATFKITM